MTWIDALIGSIGLIVVALIQRDRSERKSLRSINSREHAHLVQKIDFVGKSLGLSIDRVERNLETRIDLLDDRIGALGNRVDEHIRDHATGAFIENQ